MGTSPITPCYDAEQLETKTHMELGPGESTEYNKHRVSLEGHRRDTWCPYSYGQIKKKRGLNNVGQVNPEQLLPKQKGLWPARRGYPGCKTLQMWMARTSQPPHKCLKWTARWTMPKKRQCLCFVTGPPLARLPKPTKSSSEFLYKAERSMCTLWP